MTSAVVSRGRRRTWQHHGDIHRRLAWQVWFLWEWAGSGDALGLAVMPRDAAPLCVAGVTLGDVHRRFTWQVWQRFALQVGYLWGWAAAGDALGPAVTPRDAAPLCVAGAALGNSASFHVAVVHLRFAWQAWYLWGWVGSGDALGPAVTPRDAARRRATLRGRRGTW